MSFIEGIGDEVVLFCVVVIVFALAAVVTLIGSRPSVRRLSARQRFGRTAVQVLQQQNLQNVEVFTLALRSSVNTNTQNSVQSQVAETIDTENSENTGNISESEVVNSHEEQNIESTNTTRNDNFASTNGNISVDQDTSSVTKDTSKDTQSTADNLNLHTASNNEEDIVRNTEETDEIEQLSSETPSAPPMDYSHTNDGSEISQPPPPGEIRVRLKYLNDTERTVTSSPNTRIEDFKNQHFSEDIRNNKVVRLIFAGRLLNNSSTLQNCRILDNSVVHVQVLQAPTTQNAPETSQEAELDVGRLLWPVLTAVLGLLWMSYLKYPEFYNLMSLGILLLFTGSYFFFLSHAQQ